MGEVLLKFKIGYICNTGTHRQQPVLFQDTETRLHFQPCKTVDSFLFGSTVFGKAKFREAAATIFWI